MSLIYAASSFYEILLIVMVLIFIFNGLIRRQILKKTNENLERINHSENRVEKSKPIANKDADDEYVEYEIIND